MPRRTVIGANIHNRGGRLINAPARLSDGVRQALVVLHLLYQGEERLDALPLLLLDRGLVHAGAVVGADLLAHGVVAASSV